VAAIQMTSTDDVAANLAAAERLGDEGAAGGAALVAFPENFAFLRREGLRVPAAQRLDGPIVRRMAELARRWGAWVLLGSFPEAIPASRRIHNTSVLLDAEGRRVAVYRKMHLFYVRIPGRAVFEESRMVAPGRAPVVAPTPFGKLGLSICYDLRFPELYRRLALSGAEVLFVPSAFTAYTGRHHWATLLRARAIENQCWVVAPAQTGRHAPGRTSWGHTTVVDPWGEVVAVRPRGRGVVFADVDLDRLAQVRRELPSLRHARADLAGRPKRL
jgi:predicted amidohydrolase